MRRPVFAVGHENQSIKAKNEGQIPRGPEADFEKRFRADNAVSFDLKTGLESPNSSFRAGIHSKIEERVF